MLLDACPLFVSIRDDVILLDAHVSDLSHRRATIAAKSQEQGGDADDSSSQDKPYQTIFEMPLAQSFKFNNGLDIPAVGLGTWVRSMIALRVTRDSFNVLI